MKFELEGLDHLIKTVIKPNKLIATAQNPIQIEEWVTFVENEKVRICQVFVVEVYQLKVNQKAEYIQTHQTALSSLTDTLETYLVEVAIDQTLKTFYEQIAKVLDNIASFLQGYMNKYIDQDQLVPQSYYNLLKENLSIVTTTIEEGYINTTLEAQLIEIVLRPVKQFLASSNKISFRKALYLQELTNDLLAIKTFSTEDNFNLRFHETLCRINFNAPEYIYYCTAALDRKLGLIEDQQKKIEFLEWYIKIINQQPIKEGFALVPNLQPVNKQMLIWIKEEYQYLLMLNKPINVNDIVVAANNNKANGVKINTSLTVPQLAVMVRLFIKGGIITNETKIEVIQFVAENFTTVKAANISDESLRSKFYKVEPDAVDGIKDKLKDFMEILDKM